MAVFTELAIDEARTLVDSLQVGSLTALQGIAAGIENTNYFASTTQGEYVLTVFERLSAEQLPFYLHLMQHLARRGLPVPEPQADAAGEILHTLKGKPACLVSRLSGFHALAPDRHHTEQVGAMLARMHVAARDFERKQPNLRGLAWCQTSAPLVLPFLTPEQQALLSDELSYQQAVVASSAYAELPRGAIHADLFRDNATFDGLPGHEKLTGVFDFYFAAVDVLALDIAVCLNDWCVDQDDGRLDEDRAAALVAAYERVRPLTAGELRLLPALQRAAALRFWLSRLADLHLPRDAALLQARDPAHFEHVLRLRVAQPWHPPH